MSGYVDSLDGVAKSRYFDKLNALGLAATDGPNASCDFQNAMRLWPPVVGVRPHFLLFPGVLIHTTGAAPMEAARSVVRESDCARLCGTTHCILTTAFTSIFSLPLQLHEAVWFSHVIVLYIAHFAIRNL